MLKMETPLKSEFTKRKFEEESQKGDDRTPFQHDKDRILHSIAFRRLQYKTQVYVIHEGDFYRTRLTHTLEVSQIARALAHMLGANTDLAEAIALAHDLGHTPFGHAGGDKLRELVAEYKIPFEHNIQAYRIVSYLEERYASFDGLNLTHATLEGILRHCTYFDREEDIISGIPKDMENEVQGYFNKSRQPSVEAQIVNIADVIAYAAHDLEDALAAGLIDWDDFRTETGKRSITFLKKLMDRDLDKQICTYVDRKGSINKMNPRALKVGNRILSRLVIDKLIRETVRHTKSNIASLGGYGANLWQEVRAHSTSSVALPEVLEGQVKTLVEEVLFNSVYRAPRVMVMMEKAKRIVEVLFQAFMNEPRALPLVTQARLPDCFCKLEGHRLSASNKKILAQVIADYISGMTDKYAMDMYQLLTQAYEKAL